MGQCNGHKAVEEQVGGVGDREGAGRCGALGDCVCSQCLSHLLHSCLRLGLGQCGVSLSTPYLCHLYCVDFCPHKLCSVGNPQWKCKNNHVILHVYGILAMFLIATKDKSLSFYLTSHFPFLFHHQCKLCLVQ